MYKYKHHRQLTYAICQYLCQHTHNRLTEPIAMFWKTNILIIGGVSLYLAWVEKQNRVICMRQIIIFLSCSFPFYILSFLSPNCFHYVFLQLYDLPIIFDNNNVSLCLYCSLPPPLSPSESLSLCLSPSLTEITKSDYVFINSGTHTSKLVLLIFPHVILIMGG